MAGGAHEDGLRIRVATEADAAELLAIYAPSVEESSASFESEVPSVEAFAARIAESLRAWQWLVAEREGRCVGYAYGGSHRSRAAYRWSVEVSAYVDAAAHRGGVGRALYTRLLDDLTRMGYCNAYAGITQPNDVSVRFHERLGFAHVGTFPRVGYKFGRWHDVAWYHRGLRTDPPAER